MKAVQRPEVEVFRQVELSTDQIEDAAIPLVEDQARNLYRLLLNDTKRRGKAKRVRIEIMLVFDS